MIQPIKHFAVNWTDGMKISESHLIAHDNFFFDLIRDRSSLRSKSFEYGLLPTKSSKDFEETNFEVYKTATKDIQVLIKHCSAITAAGYRIDLSDYKTNIETRSSGENEEDMDEIHYILISVNPYKRLPFGDIDPEETPPRHPFTKENYHIDLMPETHVKSAKTGGNYIIIGRAIFKDNMVEVDRSFIPPCVNIQSHPALVSYYNTFAKVIGDLQQYSIKISHNIAQRNQDSTLALNIKALCEVLISHFSRIYFQYRNIIPESSPIYLVEIFSSIALHLYHKIQSMATKEMEEMLNYFYEWSEVAPHSLLNHLSWVAEINYDHNNIADTLVKIEEFLLKLDIIYNKLSSLDYIGERKENIIVNEKDITPTPKVKKGWSLLD